MGNEADTRLAFFCPGCQEVHAGVRVAGEGSCWQWNGDLVKATINPSILVTTRLPDGDKVCHSYIRDGQIQFLGDCFHELKNQTVDVPDWEGNGWKE